MKNGYYGLVDGRKGEVIPCYLDHIGEFDDKGWAEALLNGYTGRVSKHGVVTIEQGLLKEAQSKKDADKVKAFNDVLTCNSSNYYAIM